MIISVAGLNQVDEYYCSVKTFFEKALGDSTWTPDIKIIPEPENKFDPKALVVTIDGEKIGYVSKSHQPELIHVSPSVFSGTTSAVLFKWGQCGPNNDKFYIQLEL